MTDYQELDIFLAGESHHLWVRGNGDISMLSKIRDNVAIVGSRSATQYGTFVAADMAAALAEEGYTIVSGGAYGIDQAAHRGALAASKPTIVVSACGIDKVYPAAHNVLFRQIADNGGLIVSEYEPGTVPSREKFLARNRIIAALSAGVVVVEAAVRSGSMNTARHALDLGKPVMAVPGPVTSATSAGTNDLIASLDAHLVTNSADVLRFV